jgi:hypothetical protein
MIMQLVLVLNACNWYVQVPEKKGQIAVFFPFAHHHDVVVYVTGM